MLAYWADRQIWSAQGDLDPSQSWENPFGGDSSDSITKMCIFLIENATLT